jgi:hypothetical protein
MTILTRIGQNVIEVHLIGGEHAGKTAFIPRISITPSTEQLPFPMKRRQFPIMLSFAMSVNNQSVAHVGLDLRTDVFAHGQLYVALSRCTSRHWVKVLFKPDAISTATKDIVYPEVLL